MKKDCALSTIDNPFNPFEDYSAWNRYDSEKGYYSSSRLARIADVSDDMSEEEYYAEKERAIDEIIEQDPFNIYIKVEQEVNEIEED